MKFTKMVGAGNDFVFLSQSDIPGGGLSPDTLVKMCRRRFGVGADGLVIIDAPEAQSMSWSFFNQDGSRAEMCGNAVRCVFRYAEKKWGWSQGRVKTDLGWVEGRVIDAENTQVSWSLVNLTAPQKLEIAMSEGTTIQGQFVNSGVPHFVIDENQYLLSPDQCLEIQRHPQFAPEQTNVTMYKASSSGPIKTRSFERGVADFTLACGTGVIATALALGAQDSGEQLELLAPGGKMSVCIQENVAQLTGPAHWVFAGDFDDKGDIL